MSIARTSEEPAVEDRHGRLIDNLAALDTHQPVLAERLRWPVESDHVRFDAEGGAYYRLHGDELPLSLSPTDPTGFRPGASLAFGVGVGDHLELLLSAAPSVRWMAWDRDPWLLRLALMRRDWRPEIERGTLRFALGADLVDLAGTFAPDAVVEHPLLGAVYHRERRLLHEGMGNPTACVCAGTLYVDSLVEELRRRGYGVYTLDATRLSTDECRYALERLAPALVASINYVNGMAEFCEAAGIDYLCWEIDPSIEALTPITTPIPRTRIFTYRRAQVAAYRAAGFPHVDYLALAGDLELRRPLDLDAADTARFGAPVSFVGASLTPNLPGFRRLFNDLHAAWEAARGARCEPAILARRAAIRFEALLAGQRTDPARFRIPELLEDQCPGFRDWVARHTDRPPVELLLGEVATAEKRRRYVEGLARFGIRVWGDPGWQSPEIDYRGPAGHRDELTKIYNGSAINLDIGRLYQNEIATMRIFDCMACGGFVLAEASAALAELFEVGVEIETYADFDELARKIERYLADPDQARAIAARGRDAVVARHAFSDRVGVMLAALTGVRDTRCGRATGGEPA